MREEHPESDEIQTANEVGKQQVYNMPIKWAVGEFKFGIFGRQRRGNPTVMEDTTCYCLFIKYQIVALLNFSSIKSIYMVY